MLLHRSRAREEFYGIRYAKLLPPYTGFVDDSQLPFSRLVDGTPEIDLDPITLRQPLVERRESLPHWNKVIVSERSHQLPMSILPDGSKEATASFKGQLLQVLQAPFLAPGQPLDALVRINQGKTNEQADAIRYEKPPQFLCMCSAGIISTIREDVDDIADGKRAKEIQSSRDSVVKGRGPIHTLLDEFHVVADFAQSIRHLRLALQEPDPFIHLVSKDPQCQGGTPGIGSHEFLGRCDGGHPSPPRLPAHAAARVEKDDDAMRTIIGENGQDLDRLSPEFSSKIGCGEIPNRRSVSLGHRNRKGPPLAVGLLAKKRRREGHRPSQYKSEPAPRDHNWRANNINRKTRQEHRRGGCQPAGGRSRCFRRETMANRDRLRTAHMMPTGKETQNGAEL